MRIDATVSSATQQRQPMVLRELALRFASSRDGIGTTGAVRTDSGGDGCGLTSRELGGLNMEIAAAVAVEEQISGHQERA